MPENQLSSEKSKALVNPKLQKTIISFRFVEAIYFLLSFGCVWGAIFSSNKEIFVVGAICAWFTFFITAFIVKHLLRRKQWACWCAILFAFSLITTPFTIAGIIALIGLLSRETRDNFFTKDKVEKVVNTKVSSKDRKWGLVLIVVSAVVFSLSAVFLIVVAGIMASIAEPYVLVKVIVGFFGLFLVICAGVSEIGFISGIMLAKRHQAITEENTGGKNFPDDCKKWNWGAFAFGWIWGVYHKVYFSYLTLIPVVGFVVRIILLVKGNELAWENIKFADKKHFVKSQKNWSWWGLIWLSLAALVIMLFCSSVATGLNAPDISKFDTEITASKESALDGLFGALTFKQYSFEEAPLAKKLGEGEVLYWVSVTNKRNEIVEQGFFLMKKVSDGVYPGFFYPRDYILNDPELATDTQLKYIEPDYFNKKIMLANDGKKTGSFLLAKDLRIAGIAAINRNDLGTAETRLIEALNAVGANNEYKARIYSNIGLLYNNSHKPTEEINEMYLKAAALLDENYSGYFAYLGIVDANLGKEFSAITKLKKAIELDAENFDALNIIGGIYLHSENPAIKNCKSALEYYTRANAVGVNGARFELAQTNICLGDYQKSIELLNRELEISTPQPKYLLFYWLSVSHSLVENFTQGESYYLKTIEIAPEMKNKRLEKILCDGLGKESCVY